MDSPRGRIYLMKSLAEGRIELDDDARAPSRFVPRMPRLRDRLSIRRSLRPPDRRRALVRRAQSSSRLCRSTQAARCRARFSRIQIASGLLLAPLKLVDRLGLRPALRAIMPRMIRDWLDLLPQLNPARRPLAAEATIAPGADAPTVVVHHGCVAQVLANSENLNSERLLAAAGYRVVQLEPTSCCGALDLHSGNAARARDFARANVRALKNSGADAIVSAASGCSVAIAEYGDLLKDEPDFAEDARAVSSKVRDLSSLLLDVADESEARISMPRHLSRRLSPRARTRRSRSAAQIARFDSGRDDRRDD